MSAGWPYRCTGTIARVRGVMRGLDARRVDVVRMADRARPAPAWRPTWLTASHVAMKVLDGTMHLVARPDAPGAQHQLQRIEAVGHADAVRRAAPLGELAFEGLAFQAVDVPAAVQDAGHGSEHRVAVRSIDAPQRQEVDRWRGGVHRPQLQRARMNSA